MQCEQMPFQQARKSSLIIKKTGMWHVIMGDLEQLASDSEKTSLSQRLRSLMYELVSNVVFWEHNKPYYIYHILPL